ncbi:hypothetical protein O988_01412 [Pseudogymnoascus sp. VKM F-3808]|nr:hypothetical protein O988_01412 [Pseudogymnoascus sp. VKM F-3808]
MFIKNLRRKWSSKSVSQKSILSTYSDFSIPWVYEAVEVDPDSDPRIVVRVLLGDLSRIDLVDTLFEAVPVGQGSKEDFNCVSWVKDALFQLSQAGIISRGDISDWESVEKTALGYVNDKKRQGRFESGWEGDASRVATFDKTLGREVYP